MIFFPLSILAGVLAAQRWSFYRAAFLGTALFAVAVMLAWQVQGFAPSPRDLVWLAVVWLATAFSAYAARRRQLSRQDLRLQRQRRS